MLAQQAAAVKSSSGGGARFVATLNANSAAAASAELKLDPIEASEQVFVVQVPLQDDGHAAAREALRAELGSAVGRQGHGPRLLHLRRAAQGHLAPRQGRIGR